MRGPAGSSRIFRVTAFGGGEHRQAPVVEDQQLAAFDGIQDAGMAPVATGDGQRLEESRIDLGHTTRSVGPLVFRDWTGQESRKWPTPFLVSSDFPTSP